MLIEDRFVSIGIRAVSACAIALVGWTLSTDPARQAELQLLTWVFMALQSLCLTGAWAAWLLRIEGPQAWGAFRHYACARGVHLATLRYLDGGMKHCTYCDRCFR